MQEKISIIIPIFNVEEFLDRCISSVINQTYRNTEIILVDDGSTDGSSMICDKYAEMDERVIVIHKKNGGLVSARKEGIKIANGEFVCFVDGDDYVDEEFCEKLLLRQIETDADCVHSGYMISNSNRLPDEIWINSNSYNAEQLLREYIFTDFESKRISSSIWSKLFKQKVIARIYKEISNSNSYGEDLLCLIRCLCEQISIVSLDEAFYHYTIRDNSVSNTITNLSCIKKELELYEAVKKLLDEYNILHNLEDYVDIYFQRQIRYCLKKMAKETISIQRFTLDHMERFINSRVVIYGAGEVGHDYYSELSRIENCDIVAWVDADCDNINKTFRAIKSPEFLNTIEFDYVLIAIANTNNMKKIRKQLLDQRIDKEKIVYDFARLI